jgi:dolichol-phosphate mannosyltransferase
MTTAAVIPTRNEATLGHFIGVVNKYVDHVIVVDDSDRWQDVRSEVAVRGAEYVRGPGSGIGPAVHLGLRLAASQGHTRVVQIDCGGSHRPQDIPLVLNQDEWDIVIGSRFRFGAVYEGRAWRAWSSRVYAKLASLRFGNTHTDWTSGFRSFSNDAAHDLTAESYVAHMHGFQAELLQRAHDLGFAVLEVPIHYTAGESSLRIPHMIEAFGVLR